MKHPEILQRIEEAKHIVVIAHVNPDTDSLSSASAVYTYMLKLHKKVSLFCASKHIDEKVRFLPWIDKLKNTFPKDADLAISVDCGSYERLGVQLEIDLINFDHHKANKNFGTYNVVDDSAVSTTQVLFDFFVQNEIKINEKMATALYAGLLDDSSNFLSIKTDHRVFETAKQLCMAGADSRACSSFVSQYMSLAAYRIKGAMMLEMQLFMDGEVAVLHVDQKMMQRYGAKASDCEAALEEALYLPTVKVALLLRENKNGTFKGSLRSDASIDVSLIAAKYEGGGHYHAAGFTLPEGDMQKATEEILHLIKESKV